MVVQTPTETTQKKGAYVISADEIFPEDYPDFSEHGETPCSSAPDIFFPSEKVAEWSVKKTGSFYTNEYEAKLLCNSCPYKEACLEFALKNPQAGIWGGTTERERKRLIRTRIINARAF